MSKTLLLFIQSPLIDTYINALTHCVEHEEIKELFFVGREVLAEQESELEEIIHKIYSRVTELVEKSPCYNSVKELLPPEKNIKNYIIRVDFLRPHRSLQKLRDRFPKTRYTIIDVTGASKQLAGDVMTSFMVDGFIHVCHFVLSDKVMSKEWDKLKRSKLYHDLLDDGGVTRYTYADFSKSESIKESFDNLRARGKLVRVLLGFSGLFIILVVISTWLQETGIAKITAILSAITITASFMETLLNVSKHFIGKKSD